MTSFTDFPFRIPAIGGLDTIEFDRPVTFFVGENGAGKSTLLEAIAIGMDLNPEGGSCRRPGSCPSCPACTTW